MITQTQLRHYEEMKRVYICHPFRNDPINNIKAVQRIVTEIGLESIRSIQPIPNNKGRFSVLLYNSLSNMVTPVSPMLAFPEGMSEGAGTEVTEEQGMAFCFSLLFSCHELWVYAKTPTSGMIDEIEAASMWGIPVIWKV